MGNIRDCVVAGPWHQPPDVVPALLHCNIVIWQRSKRDNAAKRVQEYR
jgi:hypothetical protein